MRNKDKAHRISREVIIAGLIGSFPLYEFLNSHHHYILDKTKSLLSMIGVAEYLLQPIILLCLLALLILASELLFRFVKIFYNTTVTNKEIKKISKVPATKFKKLMRIIHKYRKCSFDVIDDIVNYDFEDLETYLDVLYGEGLIYSNPYSLTFKGKSFMSEHLL
ncbi:MAG: hypothetical protein KAS53_06995 [Candidatus Cloacimonetes bacterium]|nr:hypothetical protein [Candidatus Cloacimonadota bacterium]